MTTPGDIGASLDSALDAYVTSQDAMTQAAADLPPVEPVITGAERAEDVTEE